MLLVSSYLNSQQVIRARSLDAFPWLEHGFGTRLSQHWPPRPAVSVKQVHSARVLAAEDLEEGVTVEGDAIIVSRTGTLAAIRTADCLPILIADPVRQVAAAVHAGWRGTAAGISSVTVEQMSSRFGSEESDLIAVIGPGIGDCCFEVGSEVAFQFGGIFPEREDLTGRTRINLAEANRRQLLGAGLQDSKIEIIDQCTCCGSERFHSFRRDREASGRMISVVGLRTGV